jgi:ABC-type cobalamin/Fe3+-siderophores transport system ATPase subunit
MTTSQNQILLVSGPAGVGKSTLAYEIAIQLRRAGLAHVLLDSDELDRVWPLSETEQNALNRSNLAAFWSNASALGHHRLILVGVFLDPDFNRAWIEAAVPAPHVTRVVLDASNDELERRVRAREIGTAAEDQLARTLWQAEQFRLRNAGSAEVLATSNANVEDLARRSIERAGWIASSTRQPSTG